MQKKIKNEYNWLLYIYKHFVWDKTFEELNLPNTYIVSK